MHSFPKYGGGEPLDVKIFLTPGQGEGSSPRFLVSPGYREQSMEERDALPLAPKQRVTSDIQAVVQSLRALLEGEPDVETLLRLQRDADEAMANLTGDLDARLTMRTQITALLVGAWGLQVKSDIQRLWNISEDPNATRDEVKAFYQQTSKTIRHTLAKEGVRHLLLMRKMVKDKWRGSKD